MTAAEPESRGGVASVGEHASASIRRRTAITILAMVVAAGVWFPLVADHPQSWDEVQYMMAVPEFDMEKHQPHPPGYYLHVKTASLVADIAGLAPRAALIALSLVAGVVFVGLVVWWAGGLGGTWASVTAAILTILNPIVASAATEGRTYLTGALGASIAGYLSWRIMRGEKRWIIASGVAIGLTAGCRPTAAALVAPVWLWAMFRSDRRRATAGVVAAAAAAAAWALPFFREVGGIEHYLEIAARLGGPVTETSPLYGAGLSLLLRNLSRLGTGLVLLLGVGLIGIPRGLRACPGPLHWLWLWALPAPVFFLLMHIGTPSYVMVVAAPLMVLAALGCVRMTRGALSPWKKLGAFALLALMQGGLVYFTLVRGRQEADAHSRAIAAALCPLADDQTVALCTISGRPEASEGHLPYRHAGYLLPDAHVYIFPFDAVGTLGTMPNYSHELSSGLIIAPVTHPQAKRLLILGSGLLKYLPEGREVQPVYDGAWFSGWMTSIGDDEVLTLGDDGTISFEPRCTCPKMTASGSTGGGVADGMSE